MVNSVLATKYFCPIQSSICAIHTISNRTFPSRNIHVEDPEAPADIVSMNGYVIDGRVHAHLTLANADKTFGGHLEPGTTVFTFAVVTVGVFDDKVNFSHLDDKSYRWSGVPGANGSRSGGGKPADATAFNAV